MKKSILVVVLGYLLAAWLHGQEGSVGSNFGSGDRVDVHINLSPDNVRYFKSDAIDQMRTLHDRLSGVYGTQDDRFFVDTRVTTVKDEPATITRSDIEKIIQANKNKQRVVNTDAPPVIATPAGLEKTGSFRDRDLGKFLDAASPQIARAMQSIGRIEVDDVLMGTGFVAGPSQIVTNCHVIAPFVRLSGGQYQIIGSDVRIDFGLSPEHDGTSEFQITGVDFVPQIEGLDTVILHVADKSRAGANPLPPALGKAKYAGGKEPVAVVGYPDLIDKDPRATQLTQRVYKTIADKSSSKIATFGYITDSHQRGQYEILDHTSSTAGSNSGSPILDQHGNVVGVHYCCTSSTGVAKMQTDLPCGNWNLVTNSNEAIAIESPALENLIPAGSALNRANRNFLTGKSGIIRGVDGRFATLMRGNEGLVTPANKRLLRSSPTAH